MKFIFDSTIPKSSVRRLIEKILPKMGQDFTLPSQQNLGKFYSEEESKERDEVHTPRSRRGIKAMQNKSPRRSLSPGNRNNIRVTPRRRSLSADSMSPVDGDDHSSTNGSRSGDQRTNTSGTSSNWGWFEDTSSGLGTSQHGHDADEPEFFHQPLQRSLTLPPPVTEPPLYVLESPLPTQHLWYSTAGQRPKQPDNERAHYEKLWSENFDRSEIENIDDAPLRKDDVPELDFAGLILYRGKCPFSNAVSKSFDQISGAKASSHASNHASKRSQDVTSSQLPPTHWNSVTVQLPRFRIIQHNSSLRAEFLVVVSLRGIHNAHMTFGIWRRHSHFQQLAAQIDSSLTRDGFKNSILSWKCFLNRKRWYRCLDRDYLALKCFLLERFLHDVLFESQSAALISEFLDLPLGSGSSGV